MISNTLLKAIKDNIKGFLEARIRYARILSLSKKTYFEEIITYSKVMILGENICPKCGIAFPTKEDLVQHAKGHEEDMEEQRAQNLDFYPQ